MIEREAPEPHSFTNASKLKHPARIITKYQQISPRASLCNSYPLARDTHLSRVGGHPRWFLLFLHASFGPREVSLQKHSSFFILCSTTTIPSRNPPTHSIFHRFCSFHLSITSQPCLPSLLFSHVWCCPYPYPYLQSVADERSPSKEYHVFLCRLLYCPSSGRCVSPFSS